MLHNQTQCVNGTEHKIYSQMANLELFLCFTRCFSPGVPLSVDVCPSVVTLALGAEDGALCPLAGGNNGLPLSSTLCRPCTRGVSGSESEPATVPPGVSPLPADVVTL